MPATCLAVSSEVWRRYINEVAKMELVDTSRVGGVDVTRQRKLIKNGDSVIFAPQDRGWARQRLGQGLGGFGGMGG